MVGVVDAAHVTTVDLAREALRLAEADPRRAAALAQDALRRAAAERDHAGAAVAGRAAGLASFHQRDLESAVLHLRRAVVSARRADSPVLQGEAQMTLAFVLAWLGRHAAAMRAINSSVATLTGVERSRAQAQRGTILHQRGRTAEARAEYRAALPVLRRAGDDLWVARVLLNRGNLKAHQGDFASAENDLLEARRLCEGLQLTLSVGIADHNLAYVHVLRGDPVVALRYLGRAEECYRALGSTLGTILRDRSELLLSLRLVAESRETAERAVAACLAEGSMNVLPEARLLLARAALLAGDREVALSQVAAAERELRRLGHQEMAAVARVMSLTYRAGDPSQRIAPARLMSSAEAAKRLWPAVTLEGHLTVGRALLDRGRAVRARALLQRAGQERTRGTATDRARGWYAEALLRHAAGEARAAERALLAGLRTLDEHAAALGATDLRAHVAGQRGDLAALGLRIAVESGRPENVLRWAERGRASHLQWHPVRPPEDPALAAALADLRATVRELGEQRAQGRTASTLQSRQIALERQIRDHHRRQRGAATAATSATSSQLLAAALGDAALLEYVEFEQTLHVVTVVDGRTRLRALGPTAAVASLVATMPFALHRLARRHAGVQSQGAAMSLLDDTAARLDRLLVGGLTEIGDRPLVIVPTGPLQLLPWSVLPSLAGRPLSIAPSATLWLAANDRELAHGHIAVAAGPGLAGAESEARAVAAIYGTSATLGAAATTHEVRRLLDGAALAHLATHGSVRADNPLFSSLQFADGPLMVYDLEGLHRAPETVVLAACDTGRSVAPVGDELLGVSATFLAQGSRQLVASVLPILDVETESLMVELHRGLAARQPVAVALAAAQQKLAAEGPQGVATAAGFLCLGAGF